MNQALSPSRNEVMLFLEKEVEDSYHQELKAEYEYLKYKYNFIRPITYIQRYIDPQFNSRIPSPPFPEFPSGHSFQSGAATTILSEFRKSGALIIDSTVTYDVRDHVISESEITEDQEIEFPVEVIKDKNIAEKPIKEIMGKPYPIVKKMTTLEDVSKLITNENDAVIIDLENGNHHIITKYDIISAI